MAEERTFQHYNHLSGATSYCLEGQGAKSYWPSFSEAAAQLPSLRIDGAAVYGVIAKNYPLANRTLAINVRRAPWLCKPGNDEWEQAHLPQHGHVKVAVADIAFELERRLYEELCQFVDGKSVVAILLSGGMDSRVVAAVLRRMQQEGDYPGRVVAFTWGGESSRDVVYARKIASMFKWDFRHFPVSAEQLLSNINLTAELGAEFSPIHLHAMPAVAECSEVDGVIAGSYGDSIGRGEYSGRKVNELPFILDRNLNRFSLLRMDVESQAYKQVLDDIWRERGRFPDRTETSYREIDQQMHYMRRQLNACFAVINRKVPVYQAFSSPSVFGYMWSIHPECRSDEVYEKLLQRTSQELLSVPWARTGRGYGAPAGMERDGYKSLHHRYGEWLRRDCRFDIVNEILSGHLQSLGIFNESALMMWCKYWSRGRSAKADRLDEKMAWLASLSKFVRYYNVLPAEPGGVLKFHDILRSRYALVEYEMYRAALKLKKL